MVADNKGNDGADVAKNSVLNGFVQLRHILIGNNQVEFKFTGFGENFNKGFGGEILEFVDVKIKISSFVGGLKNPIHG